MILRRSEMSNSKQNDAASHSSDISIWQNERVRRLILYAVVLLVVFLLGLVPMWMTARTRASQRDTAQAALHISTLQNTLANAAIDARRGEYEPARQAASEFFTSLQAEIERGRDSVFNESQRNILRSVFDTRDDTITLLARSDPASADRLVDLYNKYRQATGGATPR
jgi:flagellar biosynthesis/type III secretory pathway M-ring protein FliF/YscJ